MWRPTLSDNWLNLEVLLFVKWRWRHYANSLHTLNNGRCTSSTTSFFLVYVFIGFALSSQLIKYIVMSTHIVGKGTYAFILLMVFLTLNAWLCLYQTSCTQFFLWLINNVFFLSVLEMFTQRANQNFFLLITFSEVFCFSC